MREGAGTHGEGGAGRAGSPGTLGPGHLLATEVESYSRGRKPRKNGGCRGFRLAEPSSFPGTLKEHCGAGPGLRPNWQGLADRRALHRAPVHRAPGHPRSAQVEVPSWGLPPPPMSSPTDKITELTVGPQCWPLLPRGAITWGRQGDIKGVTLGPRHGAGYFPKFTWCLLFTSGFPCDLVYLFI